MPQIIHTITSSSVVKYKYKSQDSEITSVIFFMLPCLEVFHQQAYKKKMCIHYKESKVFQKGPWCPQALSLCDFILLQSSDPAVCKNHVEASQPVHLCCMVLELQKKLLLKARGCFYPHNLSSVPKKRKELNKTCTRTPQGKNEDTQVST